MAMDFGDEVQISEVWGATMLENDDDGTRARSGGLSRSGHSTRVFSHRPTHAFVSPRPHVRAHTRLSHISDHPARLHTLCAPSADPPSLVTFRLMPYNHHMPTDRRSSFGFDATPPFHHLPTLSCIPSRPFPPPPPPSPPREPPAPPPYIVTERTDCFLGGRVTFVTTPGVRAHAYACVRTWTCCAAYSCASPCRARSLSCVCARVPLVASPAGRPPTLTPCCPLVPQETPGTLWEVNVQMERWLVGSQLTLNFFGDQLHQHPLRVASMAPPDAVHQVRGA